MMVISAAHMSEKYKKSVEIDYSKGYRIEAISLKKLIIAYLEVD